MKKYVQLLLVLLGVSAAFGQIVRNGLFEDEQRRYDTRNSLLQLVPHNDSGVVQPPKYCLLLEAFSEYSFTMNSTLKAQYIAYLDMLQNLIVNNATLTNDEKLVKVYYNLMARTYDSVEILDIYSVDPLSVELDNWGYFFEMELLMVTIQGSRTAISFQDAYKITNGTSPLFDAMWAINNLTNPRLDQVQSYIDEIKLVIDAGNPVCGTMRSIWNHLFNFIRGIYRNYLVSMHSVDIKGFGSFMSFYDLAYYYDLIHRYPLFVADSSNLLYILSIQIQIPGIPPATRAWLQQYHDELQLYFSNEADLNLRWKYYIERLNAYYIMYGVKENLIYLFGGDIGSLDFPINEYRYIFPYMFGVRKCVGCDSLTNCTLTTTTSTTTPSTTTFIPGICATAMTVNVVSSNTTLMLQAIDANQISRPWTSVQRNSFLGYKKRIYNIATNATAGWTPERRFNEIKRALNGYINLYPGNRPLLFDIFIQPWGTVGQYAGCPDK